MSSDSSFGGSVTDASNEQGSSSSRESFVDVDSHCTVFHLSTIQLGSLFGLLAVSKANLSSSAENTTSVVDPFDVLDF